MSRWSWSRGCLSVTCILAAIYLTTGHPLLYLRGYARNIRQLPCVSKRGGAGVCMFAWDCMKANGTHLDTCMDSFYFGSCCRLPGARPPVSEVTNEIVPMIPGFVPTSSPPGSDVTGGHTSSSPGSDVTGGHTSSSPGSDVTGGHTSSSPGSDVTGAHTPSSPGSGGSATSGDGSATSGDGSATSGDGSATSGDGSATSGDGSTPELSPDTGSTTAVRPDVGSTTDDEMVTPGEGSIVPGEGSIIPDEVSILPDEGSIIPGDGSIVPDEGSIVPDEGSIVPDEGSIVPDEGSIVPDEGSIIPGDGSIVPGEGSIVPGEGSIVPDEGSIVPDEGSIIPGEGSIVPGEGSIVPGEGSIIPGEGSVVPDEGSIIPAEGSVVPDEGSIIPDEGSIIPGEGSIVPGEGSIIPGEGSIIPGEGSIVPGEGSIVPGEGSIVPGEGSITHDGSSMMGSTPEDGAIIGDITVSTDEGAMIGTQPEEGSVVGVGVPGEGSVTPGEEGSITPEEGSTSEVSLGAAAGGSIDGMDSSMTDTSTGEGTFDGMGSTDGAPGSVIGGTVEGSPPAVMGQTGDETTVELGPVDGQTGGQTGGEQSANDGLESSSHQSTADDQTTEEAPSTTLFPISTEETPAATPSSVPGGGDVPTDGEGPSGDDGQTTDTTLSPSGTTDEGESQTPRPGDADQGETDGGDAPSTATEVSVAVDPEPSHTEVTAPGITVGDDTMTTDDAGSTTGAPTAEETPEGGVTLPDSKPTLPDIDAATPISPPATESTMLQEATDAPTTLFPVEVVDVSFTETETTSESLAVEDVTTLSPGVSGSHTTSPSTTDAAITVTATTSPDTKPPGETTFVPVFAAATVRPGKPDGDADDDTTELTPVTTFPSLHVSPTEETEIPATTIISPFLPSKPIISVLPASTTLQSNTTTTPPPAPTTSHPLEQRPIIFPGGGEGITKKPAATEELDQTATTLRPGVETVDISQRPDELETTIKPVEVTETTLRPITVDATDSTEEPVSAETTLSPIVTTEQEPDTATKKPTTTETTEKPTTTETTVKPTITEAEETTTTEAEEPTTTETTEIPTTTVTQKSTTTETTVKLTTSTETPTEAATTTTEDLETTTEDLETTTEGTVESELLERLNSSSYKDICGVPVYPTRRIVGGSEATFGEWPWQVSLRQWRQVTFLHKCGAALLNENWAITAAHCVENVQPEQLLLRLGEFDLERADEPYPFAERKVQIIATHPKFDARTFEYDLALLRFYEPVTFQPNIIPVCVPQDDYSFLNNTGYVTGWGRLYEDGPLPSVMQKVPVPVITNKDCEDMYRVAGYVEHIPNIFICAGYESGSRDSCEGDSGGPLVIRRDGVWNLAGVISWGIGCALPNQPGVYTRISEFREWIEKIIVF
ncbi:cell wall protein AWA1-like isoform X2 [Homarus americanus]|uniref:cell wall protein AWA1-like isoform X2 n=1 Tax=Homarus americanus TaxID=6706 RepID=UPI001C47D660|nr:cell wall protein AWA1-like isoform X2 [Homarus americanus]